MIINSSDSTIDSFLNQNALIEAQEQKIQKLKEFAEKLIEEKDQVQRNKDTIVYTVMNYIDIGKMTYSDYERFYLADHDKELTPKTKKKILDQYNSFKR